MVEFRPRIDSLASRLEDNNLEVALFGRVSSGKSSLLNALLNTDVLPVGVCQSQRFPRGCRYGTTLRCSRNVTGSGSSETVTVEELGIWCRNKGIPATPAMSPERWSKSPRRASNKGIVLVDTPGLGSLAKRGAAETLAYLPSCDLALLLIDAGTTLNEEDIGTLRLLCEAAIPASSYSARLTCWQMAISKGSPVISINNCNRNWAWK
jgi:hypothetical protein